MFIISLIGVCNKIESCLVDKFKNLNPNSSEKFFKAMFWFYRIFKEIFVTFYKTIPKLI